MADGVTYIPDPVGVREILYSPTGIAGRYLVKLAEIVQERAKQQVGYSDDQNRNRDAGPHLRDTIIRRMNVGADGVEMEVGSESPHALYHHEGTEPHIIKAKNVSTLFFYWPKVGGFVWPTIVHHPGTKANHYLTDPLGEVVMAGVLL